MQKIRVGITSGDINGIGLEIIIKGLSDPKILDLCTPVIYSSAKVVSYHKNIVNSGDFSFHSIFEADKLNHRKVNVLNCWQENVNITLGRVSEEGGKYAHIALDRAVRDLKAGQIDVLFTAPINKEAMRMTGFPYAGHTEFLEKNLGDGESLMMMVSENMKLALVTAHIPLGEVAGQITKELVQAKLQLLIKSLLQDFGIDKPTIAILGLNPHASDGGLMGDEEELVIRPVIIEAKKNGHLVMGPYAADGFFGAGMYRKFNAVLAMYHDQGLIPFKSIAFHEGVNFTAGLPCVRTSPDHGTAFDLAGKNEADPSSFRAALFLALDIFRNRKLHNEMYADQVKKMPKPSEELED